MAFLPSSQEKITIEETSFDAPVSESMIQKVGSTVNWVIDNVNALNDLAVSAKDAYAFFGKSSVVLRSAGGGSYSSNINLSLFSSFLGFSSGVTINSSSRITANNKGRYIIDLSSLYIYAGRADTDPSTANGNIVVRIRVNGVDVYTVDSIASSGNAVFNGGKIIVELEALDFLEINASISADQGNVTSVFYQTVSGGIGLFNLGE